MISIKDAPYSAVGDGVADDTKALQNAINAAGAGGKIYIPRGTYRITNTITIGRLPGLAIVGETWNGSTIKMDADNKPIFRFTAMDTYGVTMEELNLVYTRLQTKDKNPNGIAVEYTNESSNSNGLYHHVYRKIRLENVGYGFKSTSGGQLPIWGCKWEDILFWTVGTTCFYLKSGAAIGKPSNMFSNIKIFQDSSVVASAAFDMETEFLLDGLDCENWANTIINNNSAFNCAIRYVHIEHHRITTNYCLLFILQYGAYDVSDFSVSIRSWTNSIHTLIQGDGNSVLNARNIYVNPESGVGNGSISTIGTFKKAVVAGLMRANTADGSKVNDYTASTNNLWNIYSIDGLPPSIDDSLSLPPASADYRGRMFFKRVNQGSDVLYICLKGADGKYSWKPL